MGGIVEMVTGKPSSDRKPKAENYGNPYAQDLLARLLASIDEYKDRTTPAWRGKVPTEQRPYEWRSDEERARIRKDELQNADDQNRAPRDFAVNEPQEDPETSSKEAVRQLADQRATTQEQTQENDELVQRAYKEARRGVPISMARRNAMSPQQRGPFAQSADQIRKYIYGGR